MTKTIEAREHGSPLSALLTLFVPFIALAVLGTIVAVIVVLGLFVAGYFTIGAAALLLQDPIQALLIGVVGFLWLAFVVASCVGMYRWWKYAPSIVGSSLKRKEHHNGTLGSSKAQRDDSNP